MAKKSTNLILILIIAAIAIIIIAALFLRSTFKEKSAIDPSIRFTEHTREGNAALFILGDYFHEAFANELGTILLELPPDCTNYIVCNERMRGGLTTWTAKENLPQPVFYTDSRTTPIMKVWARDLVIAGSTGNRVTVVVAPYMHARTEAEAALFYNALRELFPGNFDVVLAPFAFEAGNLIFIERGNKRILIAGKKLLFDNARYQRRPWTPGWSGETLIDNIRDFLHVDSVVVAGLIQQQPPLEIYFDYHLDMGMTVLRENTAVVAQFPFGELERRQLRDAIDKNHPIIRSLFERERDRNEIYTLLAERLAAVSGEYNHYAALAERLGLEVIRSPMQWQHVASWRSWTNVLQVGTRLFVPVYPESLGTIAETVRDQRGSIMKQIQLEAVANDRFEMTGYNLQNHDLYADLGYDVVSIPEYLHYFEGGIHCFVNILY